MSLNPEIIRRLSIIKYLYQLGVEQSYKTKPLDSISILMFHDSIELFLELSAEFLSASIRKNTRFLEYFDKINQQLNGEQLTQKQSMNRLNRARVSLKHHGMLPHPSDIEGYRIVSKTFFEENISIVFGINFNDISLIDLVKNDKVKQFLYSSQNYYREGEFKNAIENIAIAFKIMIDDYEMDKKRFGVNSFFFKRLWKKNHLEKIQRILKVLVLDIDSRKYIKFNLLTPYVLANKKVSWYGERNRRPIKKEYVDFCFNFVIETALTLQELDTDIQNLF